jgi:DNA-binding NarL/FixJ family response regulator
MDGGYALEHRVAGAEGDVGVAAARQVVLVVDDDAGVRSLLHDTLERAGFAVLEAADGEAALAEVDERLPHLALVDVVLPRMTGYELYELLRERLGDELPIIFLSGSRTDRYDRIAGLMLGADDYIVKPFDPDELVARVRRSLRPQRSAVQPPAANGHDSSATEALTPRELEVLTLLATGSGTDEIAHDLVISPRTVGTHVQHILAKLGVHNRGQAVAAAYRAGLVDVDVTAHVHLRAAS